MAQGEGRSEKLTGGISTATAVTKESVLKLGLWPKVEEGSISRTQEY
jgi:hypothetical protein